MEPEKVRAPNIRDVAALAGVSYQTVSRVLNDSPRIKESTRQRVLDVISEIGYRPNFYVLPETTCEVQVSLRVGGSGGNCVEVAQLPNGGRALRDSKDPDGHILFFTLVEWDAFIIGVKRGEFDK